MKKPLLLLIFLGSVAVGWLARGSGSVRDAEQAGKSSETRSSQQKPNKVKPQDTREKELRDFAKRIPLLSDAEIQSFFDKLAPQDRGALIKTILKEGNPGGLSSEARSALYNILASWVPEDLDGAWDWCQQLSSDVHRRYIAEIILEKLVQKNLTRALDLHMEMNAIDTKFTSVVPDYALRDASGTNADKFIKVLRQIAPDSSASSAPYEFAKDFDFQRAADEVSALLKKHKDIPRFPRHFIQAWAERDPNAAFAWLTPEDLIGGGGSFGQLLEGIEKQGNPGAASAWVVTKLDESEKSRKMILRGMANAPAANIAGIVKALPDSNSSDRFLTDLFAEQTRHYLHDFSNTLPSMSSPKVRLEAFARAKKDGVSLAGRFLETAYQTWGITKEQFDTIFPSTEEP